MATLLGMGPTGLLLRLTHKTRQLSPQRQVSQRKKKAADKSHELTKLEKASEE